MTNPFQVTRIEAVDPCHKAIMAIMEKTGKDPLYYFAAKVLKSGKLSDKAGGMFCRFTRSGCERGIKNLTLG